MPSMAGPHRAGTFPAPRGAHARLCTSGWGTFRRNSTAPNKMLPHRLSPFHTSLCHFNAQLGVSLKELEAARKPIYVA